MADSSSRETSSMSERARAMAAALAGVVSGLAIAAFVPWQMTVLVVWDVTVVALLLLVWGNVGRLESAETATVATIEDDSRNSTRVLLLSASLASLVGVGLAVLKAKTESGALEVLMTSVAVITVILSWALVHTLYTLRYARLYYSGEPGGIDFKSDDPPAFLDFAYVAFTVGMTYQVSDTDVQSRPIRRAVLRHALLSYVFGTVIIALTINVVAGFVR